MILIRQSSLSFFLRDRGLNSFPELIRFSLYCSLKALNPVGQVVSSNKASMKSRTLPPNMKFKALAARPKEEKEIKDFGR